MKVFISYHRADTKYRKKLVDILNRHGIQYYAVPEDANFDGWHNQKIRDYILPHMDDCDALICIVGNETYTRGHVDWEIYHALKGGVDKRLGVVALMLEERGDSKNDIDFDTFPNRLEDNLDYIVIEQFASIHDRIEYALDEAIDKSNDRYIRIVNNRQPMPLRAKHYYDNYMEKNR